YPIGGGAVFARELGRVICESGSAIRTRARVAELIIEDNTARGVVLEDGERIAAPLVISTIGAFNTYHRLLERVPSCGEAIAELKQLSPAYEYINLFIGLKESPAAFGLDKGNTWITSSWNEPGDEPLWDVSDLENNPRPRVLFFSSSSLRDPDLPNRKHNGFNGQIVSAVRYGAFDSWKGSKFGKRDPEYLALKDAISERLMATLDERYPGVKDAVDYMELGTTLTYDHFCASFNGIPYGVAPVPRRYESLLLRPTTPVKKLLLCGQDLVMPGVPAAVGSANLCCSLILRRNIGNHFAKQGRELRGA
ncbi:MAG: hypothetical protein JRI55_01415, partial [Deltaproteobacteria bacterium]|nr:hypothetical protein [Deltaproteobacteria bacterium]